MDKLSLNFAKNYFAEKQASHITGTEAVILKVTKNSANQFNIDMDPNYQYFVLTYFDNNSKRIMSDNTLIVKAKEVDMNLTDAFGDKEMLVLN